MSLVLEKPSLDRLETHESLPSRFERMIERSASRTALDAGAWQGTYAELNASANRLARILRRHGATAGDRVAILMQHDTPLVVATLAVLKTAAIVVVLNPTNPVARLKQLIEDAEPKCIVTDQGNRELASGLAACGCGLILFDEQDTEGPSSNLSLPIASDNVAYLVYTSGSTGRPKGVMKTHRQVLSDVATYTTAMEFSASDRLPLIGSMSHGQANVVVWSALLNGAALCPFPVMVTGVTALADWMRERGITVYASSASIFRHFLRSLSDNVRLRGVRAVRLASEPATSDDFRLFQTFFPDAQVFVHTLASSEAGNIAWSRRGRHDAVPEGRLPVGLPSKGQQVLLVDEQDQRVLPGQVGEIVVNSRYLAAGYWRDAALTAKRFSDLGGGMRRFRTGDLGRINSDGLLEFIGRHDRGVKIRGNRIDLSEVEDALRRLPGVSEAAVEAIEDAQHEPLLTGFVVASGDQSWSPTGLRRALRSVLPDQMVPSMFVLLDRLPLTPNGKIDRGQLRRSQLIRGQAAKDPPTTESEKSIAALWAEIFGLPDIGRQDDFFALGGDSLIAAVLAARIHAASGVELELRTFGDSPTLAALAAAVDDRRQAGKSDETPLTRVSREKPPPLSLFQELAWKISQTPGGSATQVLALGYRVAGPLDCDALRDALSDVTARHEALRTTFGIASGRPVQRIHPPAPVPLPVIDLTGRPNAEAEVNRLLKEESCRVLDLTRGPLVRWLLVRIRDNDHRLLRAAHHINFDAWSSELCLREIGLFYEARLHGQAAALADAQPLQQADYAVWQRKVMRRREKAYDEAIAWWRSTIAGAPLVLEMPFLRARPVSGLAPEAGVIQWGLAPDVSHRLDQLARAASSTYYVVRLAAYAALLATVTGRRDIVIGANVTNRQRAERQSLFGFLANNVMLRLQFEPERTFREWLSIVKRRVLDTAAHGDIPHAILRKELMRKGVLLPATDAIFTVSRNRTTVEFAGLRVSNMLLDQHVTNYCFNMNLNEHNEDRHCAARFDAGWYDPEGVHAFIASYKQLLDAASRHPDMALRTLLAMCGIQERRHIGRFEAMRAIWRRLDQRRRRIRQYRS